MGRKPAGWWNDPSADQLLPSPPSGRRLLATFNFQIPPWRIAAFSEDALIFISRTHRSESALHATSQSALQPVSKEPGTHLAS